MHIPAAAILALIAALLAGCAAQTTRAPEAESPATFARAAVAADHELASLAGIEVLRAGGNAVDAAVATSFVLSVVRPYACGIGGGGFMVIHLRDDPRHGTLSVALDYREMAPAAAGPEYLEHAEPGAGVRGGKAVAVPGTVAGLLHALERYGTLDRLAVLAPAIRIAEEGFAADEHYVSRAGRAIAWFEEEPRRKVRYAFVWERFLRHGQVRAGDRIRLPEQARALRLIADHGSAAFYSGPIAESIVASVRSQGGDMTLGDLAAYQVRTRRPLVFASGGYTVVTMPPPSSGGVALAQILGILERLDVIRLGADVPPRDAPEHNSARYIHLAAEAMKHAFADRAEWMADPDFAPVPTKDLLERAYIGRRAQTISPERTQPARAYGTRRRRDAVGVAPADSGTSHLSVVDERGSAVACTETINTEFGSLVGVAEFGFVLNNEMDDFLTRPGEPNVYGLAQSELNLPAPGKRPLSSMTPTIVLDQRGRVIAVAGAAGGPRIITATAQVLLNSLWFGMDAERALGAPRFHHQWAPDRLLIEPPGLWDSPTSREAARAEARRAEVLADLTRRGHEIDQGGQVGSVQLIVRRQGGWDAASDPRSGGRPAGY